MEVTTSDELGVLAENFNFMADQLLVLLQETWKEFINDDDVIRDLHGQLKKINEELWEIEDDIRDKERAKEFDQVFIDLARSVYVTNDRRADAKKELNLYLGSEMVEEKSYQDYS